MTTSSATLAIDHTRDLKSISCVSSSYCVAVDASGNDVIWNGSAWSYPSDIDTSNALAAVSCVNATFCVAVDAKGYATVLSPADGTNSHLSQFTWDTNSSSLPLVLSDGTNDYVYGPGAEPVEQVNVTSSPPSANPLFLTYTSTNSTWLVTNTSGDEVAYYGYDAFGNLAFGTPDSPFGYAGQYTDASNSSGLSNMRARWFDPQTGGFTSRDPAFAATDTAYTYAGDDPVNESDPTGLYAPNPCGQAGAQSAACGAVEQTQRQVAAGEEASQVGANKPIIDVAGAVGNFVSTNKVAIGIGLGLIGLATGGAGFLVEGAAATALAARLLRLRAVPRRISTLALVCTGTARPALGHRWGGPQRQLDFHQLSAWPSVSARNRCPVPFSLNSSRG